MTVKVTLVTIIILNLMEVLVSLDIGDLNIATYPAHTLANYRQLLTSSTLSWADISWIQSGKIPADRVVVSGDSAVCRVRDGDKLRPGRTDRSGQCLVEGVKERKYQVLVDLTGMARLEWRRWDMFSNPEIGTVAYNDKTFIAQLERKAGDKILGDLDFNRGLNGEVLVFITGDQVEKRTKGLALVELEPVKYRLENISFLTPKESSSTVFSVGAVHLVINQEAGEEWQEVQEVVEYNYPGYEHWGHIPGTVRGLPASAIVGETTTQFRWGLEKKEVKTGHHTVIFNLRPNTGVNITVTGRLVTKEVPYTALLVMVYKDGALTRQNVSSTHISVSVEDISQDIKGPYFIKTGLPAPTTTRRPTTTTTPTTTETPQRNTIPLYAHMFLAPTPTPTLFPPPPPPVSKPNPLRQFYPQTEEYDSSDASHTVPDSVQVARMSGSSSRLPGHQIVTVLTVMLATLLH